MIQISAERVALDLAPPSAEQLDKLIQRLLLLRAQIDPPIPQRLPQDGNAIVQHQPAMQLSRDAGGNITLAVRHSGLGWCVFTLPPRQAAFLRDGLIKRTAAVDIPDIDEQLGDGTQH